VLFPLNLAQTARAKLKDSSMYNSARLSFSRMSRAAAGPPEARGSLALAQSVTLAGCACRVHWRAPGPAAKRERGRDERQQQRATKESEREGEGRKEKRRVEVITKETRARENE
jgi:hypothetical protein